LFSQNKVECSCFFPDPKLGETIAENGSSNQRRCSFERGERKANFLPQQVAPKTWYVVRKLLSHSKKELINTTKRKQSTAMNKAL